MTSMRRTACRMTWVMGEVRCRIMKESMLYPKWARPHRASVPSGAVMAGGRRAAKSICSAKSGMSDTRAPQHMIQ